MNVIAWIFIRAIRPVTYEIRKSVQTASPTPPLLLRLNAQSHRQAHLLSGNAGVRFSGRGACTGRLHMGRQQDLDSR